MVFSIRSKDPIKRVQHIAIFVPTMHGISGGIALYVWGPLFYESITQVSSSEAAISITSMMLAFSYVLGFFLEVPTGALGDAMGRKWTVVVSFYCKMLQMLFLAVVPFCSNSTLIITAGVLSTIFFQLAYTFYSGTFTAWCVDYLRKYDSNIGYERILAPASRARFFAFILGGVFSIAAYVYDVAFVSFLVGAVVCCVAALFCTAEMANEENEVFSVDGELNAGAVIQRMGKIVAEAFAVFRSSPAILAAVSVFASLVALANITAYFWPVYVRNSTSGTTQTVLWMVMVVLTMGSGSFGSHMLGFLGKYVCKRGETKMSSALLRRVMVITGLITSLSVFWLSWITSQASEAFLACAFVICIIGLGFGVITPAFETFVNNNIPAAHSTERSTILSFASLLRGLFVTILAVPTWGASGAESTVGWAIPAAVLLVAVLYGNKVMKRSEQKAPDVLAGGSLISKGRSEK